MDDKYFSRTACWHRLEGRLVVHDSVSERAPRLITMSPWHEVVFMAADGMHTVDEFVTHLASLYEGGEPNGLRQQIHGIITELIDEGVLSLHDDSQALPSSGGENGCPPECCAG